MARRDRILIVDDVEQSLLLMSSMVQELGYEVETALDGLDALAKLELLASEIDLVLLDVEMPRLDGYEVARRLRENRRFSDLPVIMVTVLDSREDRLRAVQAGASDFISKPVDRTELMVRVSSQLKLKAAQDALKRYSSQLEEQVAQRTARLREALQETADAQRRTYDAHVDTIRRLVLAAELKDAHTAEHIVRLSLYSGVLARALRFAPGEAEVLRHAVTMHDVGKIGIPDTILTKPGSLTTEERQIMETHTAIGARILADSPSELLRAGQVIALSHHERWDGSGYPQRLAGERIPLHGRICAVLDVFDALTSERPYREALSADTAIALMMRDRGLHFDPTLLDLFAAHRDEVVSIHARLADQPPETGSGAAAEAPP